MDFSFFTEPFVWRAIAAGALISVCAALLGVTLVLRRLSFMGDGLSHVAFGAMAVAGALNLAGVQMAVALPVTAACAVLLLRGGAKVQGDAALAMLSVGAMASGYLMMNLFPATSNVSGDVCTTLFGAVSILTLTNAETVLCVVLSVVVAVFHLLTYHCNFDIAFDEDFARASGVRTSVYNVVSAIVTAVVIVVSMRLVGALLVSALLVFPAVSAMKVGKSFRAVTILAAAIALATALAGIFVAVAAGTPVGATIVIVDVLAFCAFRARRTFALIFAVALCVLCAVVPAMRRVAPPVAQGGSDVRVIASIYPLYDWTLNVAGARTNTVSVTLLQRGGVDFHSFQPSADDIRAIKSCSLFIHVGGVSDAWCEKVSAPSSLALMDALPPRLFQHNCHDHHCDGETAKQSNSQTAKQSNSQTVKPSPDEHIWLSLVDAQKCVAAIAERLAAIDPEGAGEYRANAASYIAELRKLDALFREKAALHGSKPLLFADRFPFARLADDYSLHCIAAFHGCSADAEASFHTIFHLAEEIDEHDLSTIFILKEGNSRLAEAVRAATTKRSARIVPLDSMQGIPSASYIQTMRETLDAMF